MRWAARRSSPSPTARPPPCATTPRPAAGAISSEITDRSGTTTYSRDAFGRVIAKTQTLASGLTQQVAYSYTAAGQLAAIAYPNGSVLAHPYDATGRLVQLSWNGSPLVTGIAWNPMGQPTAWRWAFAPASMPAAATTPPGG